MTAGPLRLPRSSSGFSLVEILVGVVIGLIGIVIMFQVMENAENRKRTTASGSDAQIAGSIAMHNLVRDIRLGGNGFGSSAALGCTVNAYDTVRGAAFTFPMVPVQIIDGAAGAADQIITFYGNSPTAATSYAFDTSSAFTKKMASTSGRGGLMRGDLVLVTGTGCGLIEVTGNTNADQLTINHAIGAYTDESNNAATARFNAPAGYTLTSGQLYSLGNNLNPRRNIWQIANLRTLTVTNDLHNAVASEVGEGIVNLQAEYGLDTDGDFQVDLWQTADPGNWRQLFAIRVGLLARSQQYEKANVTTVAPTWEGGTFTMTNLDGTADNTPNSANDWRHYRYRVYQVTIPLRNMIWGVVP